jgi:hypothetical protein
MARPFTAAITGFGTSRIVWCSASIASGAEGPVAGSGEDRAGDAAVGPAALEGVDQLLDGAAAKGVEAIGPVDGDDRVRLVGLVSDVLVVHAASAP